MINLKNRIEVFEKLRNRISKFLTAESAVLNGDTAAFEKYKDAIRQAGIRNQWFTNKMIDKAFGGIVKMLDSERLYAWLDKYHNEFEKPNTQKNVGIIMAGNIPMVGFHDLLCVLVSGHKAIVKLSSDDSVLMEYLIEQLIDLDPSLKNKIQIADRLNNIDAVIATGSNNSSRYFEYYFGKYPHIIRKNRSSIAILNGNETNDELTALGEDIFAYFGLGCRNISKVFVPEDYVFDRFFESLIPFSDIMNHNKYMNNYNYHHSIYLLNNIPFLTNNFLIIKQDEALATPVSVLNYQTYKNPDELKEIIELQQEQIQCIVSREKMFMNGVSFGNTQTPSISDYADNVDTMQFLFGLN